MDSNNRNKSNNAVVDKENLPNSHVSSGLQLRKISVRRVMGDNSNNSPGADNNSHQLDSISIHNISPPLNSHLYMLQNRKISESKQVPLPS